MLRQKNTANISKSYYSRGGYIADSRGGRRKVELLVEAENQKARLLLLCGELHRHAAGPHERVNGDAPT